MVMLLVSETPLYFFTLLDILKIPALYKYRLHYAKDVSSHLGTRVYPPLSAIKEAAKNAEFNFWFAYMVPGSLGIAAANKLGIFVYDTDREISWKRLIKETFIITVVADLMFYGVHKTVHLPALYQTFHKKHHEWKYSMALAHHYMTYKEALLFAIPQAFPPLLLIPFLGKQHVLSMWLGFCVTQMGAIFGHAGYQVPGLPSWSPMFRPEFHDYHHIDFDCNFAANYEFTDALFGTLVRAPMASALEVAKHAGERIHCYVSHKAAAA